MSTENRLNELESRVAFQEDLIQSLNTRIAEQETELAKFQLQLQHLNQKMKQMQDTSGSKGFGQEPPPPHY